MPLSRVNSRKFCEPIGCRVTQVARSGILPKEDDDTIVLIEAALREDGVRLLTHTRTLRCEVVHEEQRLVVTSGPSAHPDQSSGGAEEALPFNLLLCAIGRRARETGFGLEALGIPLTTAGTIETNAYLQTCYPKILACRDVVGPHQFTHVAAHQAWYAAVNVLGTIHPYPTWSEAAKYAAGNWKRAHAPQTALDWLARFHTWRRG